MEITDTVRMVVITDLIEELTKYGHYQAVERVSDCRKRLLDRIMKDRMEPRLVRRTG